ncbi:MAG: N-acetyltransferase [Porticoccaceae bacterium]
MHIRDEQRHDRAAVHRLNTLAFDTPAEADLVDALRGAAQPIVSLVADDDGTIAGHILFTPVSLPGHAELKIMGLAPMAVTPGRQRGGLGSQLVAAGLECCRRLGFGAVVVLGHPDFYPRFGFAPATRFGIGCAYDVPAEAFMAMELQPGYLAKASGTIRYHPAFDHL